jgi:hypothetical protein
MVQFILSTTIPPLEKYWSLHLGFNAALTCSWGLERLFSAMIILECRRKHTPFRGVNEYRGLQVFEHHRRHVYNAAVRVNLGICTQTLLRMRCSSPSLSSIQIMVGHAAQEEGSKVRFRYNVTASEKSLQRNSHSHENNRNASLLTPSDHMVDHDAGVPGFSDLDH